MIASLNSSLFAFLQGEAPAGSELAGATISFSAPTRDWRGQATGLVLNIYLYQITENRELRSNEPRFVRDVDGSITRDPFPARIECTYLITAWNKEQVVAGSGPTAEPEHKEHRLLSQALFVLLRNNVVPQNYLVPALSTQMLALPMISARADTGQGGVPDFWTGLETYLRPVITCRITLTLDLKLSVIGPMVTTTVLSLGPTDGPNRIDPAHRDRLHLVGGTVRSTAAPRPPVAAAAVRVDNTGDIVLTDANGRFVLEHLDPGAYMLSVSAPGFQTGTQPIQVPQPNGSYDLNLIPI